MSHEVRVYTPPGWWPSGLFPRKRGPYRLTTHHLAVLAAEGYWRHSAGCWCWNAPRPYMALPGATYAWGRLVETKAEARDRRKRPEPPLRDRAGGGR